MELELIATETLIIGLLLIAALVAIVAQRLRLPYTVALVVVGLFITMLPKAASLQVELTPGLIFALLLPPLLFEAAFHIQFSRLLSNLRPIVILAIPGVLISTFIVGAIISSGIGIPLATALVFGALISATDPVAVVALFRALGAPKTLTVQVEGESLFNDGTAVVLFSIALAAAVPAAENAGEQFDLVAGIIEFLRESVGGLTVGIVLGYVISQLIKRLDNYLIETTLTTVLAFGSFLVANELHFSGVLAVVAAGIVNGNVGPKGMSPTTRIVLFNFWEFMAFTANSFVFLLIGLTVDVNQLISNIGPIAIAVAAVIVARAIVVYGLTWLLSLRGHSPPMSYRHVLFWGGLRGAVSLALVLGLPEDLPQRELLQPMAFGVVLFSLLVQGSSMQFLLGRLGLIKNSGEQLEYERRHGRLMAARAARSRLEQLGKDGVISAATLQDLANRLNDQIESHLDAQNELLNEYPALREEDFASARRETLKAQRARLATLARDGIISEHVHAELGAEVDEALDQAADSAQEPESSESRVEAE